MSWATFDAEERELATAVRNRFDAHLHHVLGTIRRDGSVRLSGTEVGFREGEMWLGMMPRSAKAADLQRDPRFALHSAPVDVHLAAGDATIGGRAVEVVDAATRARFLGTVEHDAAALDAEVFRLELAEVSLVTVRDERLRVATWHPGGPVVHVERS